ncbi:hypothetical protein LB553_21150 [Mesorhizobium sp. CA8]|uniref:hypothetical protein n=1 Tax=Mesorhizobium sp. CA8 TaxID=2876637 RepID=UPI001CCF9C07|nr:hypothetical protein [Mesorhizobium sp. CA8]MBZ9763370.1 hypothetical protein [Mesorhizobium sp. CA8]
MKKQAVVIIHGMGEQIPMETLRGFVDAVWVEDPDLIRKERPDSTTGEAPRTKNRVWSKPDGRNRSYELRRITTERLDDRGSTDFFEFYWAHLIYGTTWEQIKSWIVDLLWRAPSRVPKGVRQAWILLWVISICVALAGIVSLVPLATLRSCMFAKCLTPPPSTPSVWGAIIVPVAVGVVTLLVAAFVNTVLLKYFGDVARYVKAKPLNVARRQEIREKGVELLDTLMGRTGDGNFAGSEYDRIVVVAHSLGTIVAYDILTHCFARLNTRCSIDPQKSDTVEQPERIALERMLRSIAGLPTDCAADAFVGFDIDLYQRQQGRCRQELNGQGNPWLVSDFITLGSPLAHAEFLLARDADELERQKIERVFPTCPPTLEYDGTTKLRHFTYKPSGAPPDTQGLHFRWPHHAALFAYTRWTNLYSPHKAILWGDIISGPLAPQFGLDFDGKFVNGIRDIQVMPLAQTAVGTGWPPFFAHLKYWQLKPHKAADHIKILREVLNLKEGK